MSTIPASELVQTNPGVLSAAGTAFEITGLMLTNSAQPPLGSVLTFSDQPSVAAYFGGASLEAALATNYFSGFVGKSKIPAFLKYAQYNQNAVSAYLRGGNVSGMALATLQAINGTLTVSVDGTARNGGTVNLSSATSFSSAAALIQTALNSAPATIATFTASITTTVLTVTGSPTGSPIGIGQTVVGAGVAAGTRITALGTGTGGAGTYTVNNSQSVVSESMTTQPTAVTVTYDSTSGGFLVASAITGVQSTAGFATGTASAALELTSATGAVLSQGAAAAAPAAFMGALVTADNTWTNFMTTFDPDASGNTVKQAFDAWSSAQASRYGYVCWDLDQSPVTSSPAAASLGQILAASGSSGTFLIDGDATNAVWTAAAAAAQAAFVMGTAASIDFGETGGRITFAYKSQAGIAASVVTATAAINLGGNPQAAARGNNYNFYGAYGSAGAGAVPSVWLQRGFVTGAFKWFDSYVNQVWLNASIQTALRNFLGTVRSVPYNDAGYSQIEAALAGTIAAGLNFGAYAPGPIDPSQIAQVNASAGRDISNALQTQGWYLLITPASSTTRAARTSPPMKFFYLDRGSIQALNIDSISVN